MWVALSASKKALSAAHTAHWMRQVVVACYIGGVTMVGLRQNTQEVTTLRFTEVYGLELLDVRGPETHVQAPYALDDNEEPIDPGSMNLNHDCSVIIDGDPELVTFEYDAQRRVLMIKGDPLSSKDIDQLFKEGQWTTSIHITVHPTIALVCVNCLQLEVERTVQGPVYSHLDLPKNSGFALGPATLN